ncbi:RBR-type E3 ubiquitin transferase [Ascochyta rabiei]|uniref:Zinc ion binding n=1 Tax=Didymella rabiei TaxID=5454 RepID=A0A163GLB0_DIDRA|nr:RBR-type E3 ubiquitin transferase [Ascochyta rabiei]KZM24907.1 zinc ion binding [Ascochyta rabiei]UPX12118.1 RBR-type E3 ubiquitin transferase [Ascochyta rabiei]
MTEVGNERAAELETLGAICADNLVVQKGYSGYIEIPVALQTPLQLFRTGQGKEEHGISQLPPIRVCFDFPENYPTATAHRVQLKSCWLPDGEIQDLQAVFFTLWEEYGHAEILYAYINYIQECAELAFGLECLDVVDDLLPQLLD